jgi:hypothetical protein
MRNAKVVLALLVLVGAVALSGCIIRPAGHVSTGVTVEYEADGNPGGPPPGRGWRK